MPLDTCETQVTNRQRDTLRIARAWLDLYPAIAVATVIKTWGSAPVPVGGQLVIAPGERVEGSVSGGCVEAAVITEACAVMASGVPKVLGFGVEDEMAWRVGLPCGGRIEVMIARYAGDRDRALLDQLIAGRRTRDTLVLETNLASGERRLHTTLDAFEGDTRETLLSGTSVTTGGETGAFLHVHVPETQLILVGAGHIGQVLAGLASLIGYKVTVIDPRGVYASLDRFQSGSPDEIAVIQDWPEAAFAGHALDRRSAVMTLSHAADIDDEALLIALKSPCFYVGALGSRRSHAERVKRLLAKGLSEEDLARLDAPAGLPIGAVGPHEIAVSMLAAVIKAARSHS